MAARFNREAAEDFCGRQEQQWLLLFLRPQDLAGEIALVCVQLAARLVCGDKEVLDFFEETKEAYRRVELLLQARYPSAYFMTETHRPIDSRTIFRYCYELLDDGRFDGIIIFSSNFSQNIDAAFMRRIRFVIHFPIPDAQTRKEIWQSSFAAETPQEGIGGRTGRHEAHGTRDTDRADKG